VSSTETASFAEERPRPKMVGTRPVLMETPWGAVASRRRARHSVELRELRDTAAVLLQGVNQFGAAGRVWQGRAAEGATHPISSSFRRTESV
jgi:hypothetical protein